MQVSLNYVFFFFLELATYLYAYCKHSLYEFILYVCISMCLLPPNIEMLSNVNILFIVPIVCRQCVIAAIASSSFLWFNTSFFTSPLKIWSTAYTHTQANTQNLRYYCCCLLFHLLQINCLLHLAMWKNNKN